MICDLDSSLVFINVGDSRSIMSKNNGSELMICTYDHKPQFFGEMQRVFKAGGQLYRVCNNRRTNETEIYNAFSHKDFLKVDRIPEESGDRIFGPWRVKPGGLSVSRTFGDIEAKIPELGGMKNVVSAEPEIQIIPYSTDIDYVMLGCDGIFDSLTNEEVNAIIWETIEYYRDIKSLNRDNLADCLNDCVNNVLKKSLINQSEDNVTVILIMFRDIVDN